MTASTRLAVACVALVALGLAVPENAVGRSSGHGTRHHAPEKPAAGVPATDPLTGPPSRSSQPERTPFTAAEAASARPEGLPGTLRIPGDDTAAFKALVAGASAAGTPWLVLSGGGENGAFSAGILSGWSQAGDRPDFGVISGVSTGALIAPFAFVGPSADAALKRNYTEISAADVFEFGGTNAALVDTWPLKERIDRFVTPDLLKAIAAEHAKGRRLLVATTEVDVERQMVWDMGAIASLSTGPEAARFGDKPLKLFRAVVLASSAVPGVFPPVMIDAVTEGGKRIQEMHDDGGAMSPFFFAPAEAIEDGASVPLPARTVYLVINNRLTPEFGVVPRTVLGVLGGTMSAAIKAQTRASLALARAYAQRSGFDLRVAEIDRRFTAVSPGPFDAGYMKALFEHGEAVGRAGTAFKSDRTAASDKGKAGFSTGAAADANERGDNAQR